MDRPSNHFDIAIATPGRDMVRGYTRSLLNTVDYFHDNNIKYCYLNEYSSFVPQAREWTFKTFYERHGADAKYNKMIWIDSDISWEIEDIMSLYESDKDIVTGAYLYHHNMVAAHRTPYHAYSIKELDELDDYERILYCGLGFIAMKHGILENIQDPFTDLSFDYDGKVHRSGNEDVSFCIRAAMFLGKELWIDPKIRVNHHKTHIFSWDNHQEQEI